jgi:hypothetical protein
MLSVSVCPKVITLSGFHCSYFITFVDRVKVLLISRAIKLPCGHCDDDFNWQQWPYTPLKQGWYGGGGINLFLSSSFQCQGGTHLVSDEPDAATNLWGDGTFESALAKEAVDCLDLVPT